MAASNHLVLQSGGEHKTGDNRSEKIQSRTYEHKLPKKSRGFA